MERLIFLTLFCFFVKPAFADFESAARRVVARVVAEPSLFFREIKSDSETSLPIKSGYNTVLGCSLFPSLLPITFITPSFSRRIHPESEFPQMDLNIGFEYFVAGKTFAKLSDEVENLSFWGYHTGITASNSITSRIRNFYGVRYSYSSAELKLSSYKKHELLGVELSNFRFDNNAVYVYFGIELMRDIDRYFALQINYDIKNEMIAIKSSWYGKWFELGFNFYPDGVVVIHPIWNMRLSF
ncbi:MAG: hypothetical protein ACP5IO_02950 [Elusimicrobiales bacterium]